MRLKLGKESGSYIWGTTHCSMSFKVNKKLLQKKEKALIPGKLWNGELLVWFGYEYGSLFGKYVGQWVIRLYKHMMKMVKRDDWSNSYYWRYRKGADNQAVTLMHNIYRSWITKRNPNFQYERKFKHTGLSPSMTLDLRFQRLFQRDTMHSSVENYIIRTVRGLQFCNKFYFLTIDLDSKNVQESFKQVKSILQKYRCFGAIDFLFEKNQSLPIHMHVVLDGNQEEVIQLLREHNFNKVHAKANYKDQTWPYAALNVCAYILKENKDIKSTFCTFPKYKVLHVPDEFLNSSNMGSKS